MRTICLKVTGLVGAIFGVEDKKSGPIYRPKSDPDGFATDPVELILINDRPAGLDNLADLAAVRGEAELLNDPQHHRPTLSFTASIDAALRGGDLDNTQAAWDDRDNSFFGEATFRLASEAVSGSSAKKVLSKRRYVRLEGLHLDIQGDGPLKYEIERPEDWEGISWLDYAYPNASRADDIHMSRSAEKLGAAALGRVTLNGGTLSLGDFTKTRWTLSKDPLGIDHDGDGVYFRESLELRWQTDADTIRIPLHALSHSGWSNAARFTNSDSRELASLIGKKGLMLELDVSNQPKDEEVELLLLNSMPKFFRDQTLTADGEVDFCYTYFYRLSQRPKDSSGRRTPIPFEERALPHRRDVFGDATPSNGGGPFCPFGGLRNKP